MTAPMASYTMTEQIIDNAKYLVTSCLTALAQMSMGQVFLRGVDRGFWIIEKSAQWSLPYHETQTEENGKSFQSMELVRPLPWVLFLPALILLRLFRFGWNLGAAVIGYPSIEPSDIVKYVQKTRRRLRTIKTNGIKTLRQKRVANNRPLSKIPTRPVLWNCIFESLIKEKSLQEANRSLIKSIQLTLSSLSCLDTSKSNHSPPPTRIQVSVNHEMLLTPDDDKSATESAITTFKTVDQKRKYTLISSDDQETDESENETLGTKIDRLAREDSFDDKDFEPQGNSDSDESSQTDLEDEEDNVSQDEVEALLQENNTFMNEQRRLSPCHIDWKDTSIEYPLSTCPTTREKSPEIELAIEEQRDYFSPQSGDDGETAFYSPISSKSASPERVLPTSEGRHNEHKLKETESMEENCNADMDGNVVEKSNGHAETSGSEQIPTANKCPSKFQPKPHHKGKRMIHGSRKKK